MNKFYYQSKCVIVRYSNASCGGIMKNLSMELSSGEDLCYGECPQEDNYIVICAQDSHELLNAFKAACLDKKSCFINLRDKNCCHSALSFVSLEAVLSYKEVKKEDITAEDLKKLSVAEYENYLRDALQIDTNEDEFEHKYQELQRNLTRFI